MKNCIDCGSHNVSILKEEDTLPYKGKELAITVEYSVCKDCDSEFISPEQFKANNIHYREVKKKEDGLLLSDQMVKAREKLDLTQEEAATIFGGGRNAFSKYERGEVTQSESMDKLIRLALKYPFIIDDLKSGLVGDISRQLKSELNIPSFHNVVSYSQLSAKRAENDQIYSKKTLFVDESALVESYG